VTAEVYGVQIVPRSSPLVVPAIGDIAALSETTLDP
jgi:hypothetical protein